ncbi:hypothetical protein DFA_08884 [Cavenderia fasciculata]|uniref:Transmembrane protein n=1 Tax=Cavenderia fasciculata TaxID=261658 RepID=F4Q4T7_CACFS|nr:uncharacterized protein DFA_08884 [Cavenderia fasciculata]EGG17883.1 hypothetical protein DFA_08884 [Cavenderia fasciculata]|eukprot:XP_004356367.1 hypothetical protein DFA_08884 [Cavenderia fasciculata]
MGSKLETALRVIVIFCGVALACLTIPYWIYMKIAIDHDSYVPMGIYIASAIILLILAFLGIFGAIRKSRGLLLYFAVVMIMMFLFGIAQIIVTALDVAGCGDDPSSNFSFLCSVNTVGYYVPVGILLFINIFGAVMALWLRYKLVHDTEGKYY